MTDAELLAAIVGNPTLKQHAINGEDGTIARALTRESDAAPLTIAGLMGLLSPQSLAKLATNPNVMELRNQIKAQDLDGVRMWAALFVGGGVITQEEHAAVVAACHAAEPNGMTVDYTQVSKVLRPLRSDGKVGGDNWLGE